jgi:adsorption protein B
MTASASAFIDAVATAWASFDPAEAARGYWRVLQVLTTIAAVVIFVSSIDDLFIDLAYWWISLIGFFRRLWRPPPSRERLARALERSIAIMVPAWHEAEVIATMIANTINTYQYQRFHIFVGVYANDPGTRAEVDRMRRKFPNVHRADVPNDGPTSKADCLNWIIQNVLVLEEQTGEYFDIFLMHDAEDVVHPFELKTVNGFMNGKGMIQLPVLSMNRPWTQLIACHYLDEFAEFHSKDLPVRSALSGMTPSAGVATAFSRAAIEALRAERHNEPFNTGSLTEDYDVAHRLHRLGFHSAFIRYFAQTTRFRNARFRKGQVPYQRKELVATKEYFPDRWTTSVRQKARWMLGISIMGWRQLGWFGDLANRYFLFRDRKALFTAPTGVLAYILLLQQLAYWGAERIDPDLEGLPPLVTSHWLELLVLINLGFLVNRLVYRLWFTGRTHGLGYVWLAPVRMILANLIGFGAFWRATRIFVVHLFTGKSITWDKTDHAFPSASELKLRRGRLGDILSFWNHVDPGDLDAALRAQKHRYRPLGLLLLDRAAIKDEDLAEAFAEQANAEWDSFDPLTIDPAVLRKLTPRQAGLYGAVPLRNGGDQVEIALAEPLSKTARAELDALLLAGKEASRVVCRYAPLADVAFAVRWAWTPAGLAAPTETVALMRRLQLIDDADETRLWRAIRSHHTRLGDLLVRAGAIDHEVLQKALAAGQWTPSRLGEYLTGQGLITAADLQSALALQAQAAPKVLDTALALGLIGEAQVPMILSHAPAVG